MTIMVDSQNNPSNWIQRLYRPAVAAGAVAVLFCLGVGAVMVWDAARVNVLDPLNTPALKEMKARLVLQPGDEPLRKQIRELDLQVRREYVARRWQLERGRYLLAGGVAAFLLFAGLAVAARKRAPMPQKFSPEAQGCVPSSVAPRIAVLAGGLAIAVGLFALTINGRGEASWLGQFAAPPPEEAPQAGPAYPSDEEVARNWPRFRGPGGLAQYSGAEVSTQWDGASGSGIAWKTPIALSGMSSPVAWGDRVFLTGATKNKRELYCLDATAGKVLWTKSVDTGTPVDPEANDPDEQTGFAASTAATDGRRVCAIFANGDLACFDYSGKQLWARSLGHPESTYGYASSLTICKDLLLVQYDQGTSDQKKSALIAFKLSNGVVAWKAPREVDCSWSTPTVAVIAGREQVITVSKPLVISYDGATGKELWRATWVEGYAEVAPSPAVAGGNVIVTNSGASVTAIPAAGDGDVTAKIAWTSKDSLPDICSPLGFGDLVLLVDSSGVVTCYQAADGKKVWQQELNVAISSSPVLANGRIYLFDRDGKAYVLQAGREFKQLAVNSLGEPCYSSPAMVDGRIYIRTAKHLICIGKSK